MTEQLHKWPCPFFSVQHSEALNDWSSLQTSLKGLPVEPILKIILLFQTRGLSWLRPQSRCLRSCARTTTPPPHANAPEGTSSSQFLTRSEPAEARAFRCMRFILPCAPVLGTEAAAKTREAGPRSAHLKCPQHPDLSTAMRQTTCQRCGACVAPG